MKVNFLPLIVSLCISFNAISQADLSYYLPEGISYNSAIPTPKSIIGHEVGEWHISHDRLVSYMYALDAASDRISLEVTGYTHEARPLLLLTITAPENHQKIEAIRTQHLQLTDPSKSGSLDIKGMPSIFYMGFSIHGNEPSGSNASLLAAYHLAAAQGPEIENYLKNTVILFDPSFNPDGLHRFSSWVNSRKSKVISTDPADMEHNESWPRGRTNHYWFDLNRDWLVAQQPESQARIKKFQMWKPNVLTDHHEMGTNATFFFMPGEPSRVNPITPKMNQTLTQQIGEYHAMALDNIGSLYYSKEGYDDFYYGKGSTFPDAQGSIGILFEQASSRGHAQESTNGILRFPFTIRNHFVTALSSLKAVNEMRETLLNYQRDFYKNAATEASKDPVKAYLFGSKDRARAFHLAETILRQDIEVYKPSSTQTINGITYDVESSYIVPLNQRQYKLIKGMFVKQTQFEDSLFYDISSWTLPLAYGTNYEELKSVPSLGTRLTEVKMTEGKFIGDKDSYAYAFEGHEYYTPRAVYRLLDRGVRVKVATEIFYHPTGKKFERGSIMIPLSGQDKREAEIDFLVREIAELDGIDVYGFSTGLDFKGKSLGSGSFETIRKPQIAMLVDGGVSGNDAGEMWHLLDVRMEIPVTMIPIDVFNRNNLLKYNTIILPPGSYSEISDNAKDRLKTWVQNGGVLIGLENALNWFTASGLGKFEMKKGDDAGQSGDKKNPGFRPYSEIDNTRGAQETSGSIFEARVDLTHPLLFGYSNSTMPIFKGNNLFMEKSKNAFGNPITFESSPLMSGYISKPNYNKLKNSSIVGVSSMGQGRVIGFTENLSFRAFWFGTNKLLTNAIFYGPIISSSASR